MIELTAERLTAIRVPEAVARQNMPPSLESCSACNKINGDNENAGQHSIAFRERLQIQVSTILQKGKYYFR